MTTNLINTETCKW